MATAEEFTRSVGTQSTALVLSFDAAAFLVAAIGTIERRQRLSVTAGTPPALAGSESDSWYISQHALTRDMHGECASTRPPLPPSSLKEKGIRAIEKSQRAYKLLL